MTLFTTAIIIVRNFLACIIFFKYIQSVIFIFSAITLLIFYFRSAVVNHGMWDQIRVDHGKEFYLCLYMQERLSGYRHNLNRLPYLQTTSTRVRVE